MAEQQQGEAQVESGSGLRPVDIPVPIFPQRTTSVPVLGTESQKLGGNNHLPLTLQKKADWRLFLSIEERQLIRKKITEVYQTRTKSYEELLETCAAIEEELVFLSAPSRLDYFKTGMQFDKRVIEKRKQLTDGPVNGATSDINSSSEEEKSQPEGSQEAKNPNKKQRTNKRE